MSLFDNFHKECGSCEAEDGVYEVAKHNALGCILDNCDTHIEIKCVMEGNHEGAVEITISKQVEGSELDMAVLRIDKDLHSSNKPYIEIQNLSAISNKVACTEEIPKGMLKGMVMLCREMGNDKCLYLHNACLKLVGEGYGVKHFTLTICDCVFHLYDIDGDTCVVGVSCDKDKPEEVLFINKTASDDTDTEVATTYFVRYAIGDNERVDSVAVDMPREVINSEDFELLISLVKDKIEVNIYINIIKFIPIERIAELQD